MDLWFIYDHFIINNNLNVSSKIQSGQAKNASEIFVFLHVHK